MKYINMILFIVIVSETIISCGGGSGGGDKNPIKKIEGYVIDGNISEANVSIYESNNTFYEANVSIYNEKYKISKNIITDKNGKYAFSIDSNISKIDIISYGGEDTLSEEVFEGVLQARVSFDDGGLNDNIFVTPLSTLLVVSDGNKNASKIIKYNLGIDGNFNLMNDNPLGGGIDDKLKIKLFQGTQQVQKVAEIIKDTLGNDIYYEQIFKAIYLTMADNYNSNNRAVINEKEILKSPKLIENVVSFVKSGNKEKAKIKLNTIGSGIESTVDIIYGDDVKINDIKLTAMAIEVVTNSYEEKAKEINKDINLDKDVFGLKSDIDDIKSSYTSLNKVRSVVSLAQDLAQKNNEVVSLPLLGAFLAKKISSNGVSDLEESNIKNTIEQSVVAQERKNEVNNHILSNNTDALSGGTGGSFGGGGGGSGGSGGGSNSSGSTPQVEIIRQDGNAQIINDSNKSNYPKIPDDGINKDNSSNTDTETGTEQKNTIGKPENDTDNGEKVPDVVNSDKVPKFNLN